MSRYTIESLTGKKTTRIRSKLISIMNIIKSNRFFRGDTTIGISVFEITVEGKNKGSM